MNKLNNIRKKLKGSIYTVFTFFKKDGKVDYNSTEKYLNFLNKNNADVFYVMPYNSRYSQLREKEIFELNNFCIEKVKSFKNKLIIVSDAIHGPTSLSMEYCHAAKEKGADIFASICREKFFSEKQIYNHYLEINSCKMPLLIHSMPFLSGYNSKNFNWPISLLIKISKLKNVIAMKEDTQDPLYAKKLLKKMKNKISIIFAGRMDYFLKIKKYGFETYLNGSSIIDPKIDMIFLELLNLKNADKLKRFVKDIDDPFWNIIVKKYGWHRVNKAAIEAKLNLKRYERPPMISLSESQFQDIKKWVKKLEKDFKKWL